MMHVVLGDGEMSRRELSKTLEDLLEKAENEDFWFLVQGKAEPTTTDKALMDWLKERQVYFEVITDDKKGMDDAYKGAQETHEVKRLAPKVLSLMQEKPTEGEEAALFGLFVNNDADVPEDTWLNDVMTTVVDGGYKVFAMNDGLVELGLEEVEGEEEAAEEAEPDNVVPMKPSGVSKKSAAKAPAVHDEDPAFEERLDEAGLYTRDQLADMNAEQLREVGIAKGLPEFPPRTRMTTMINAILGENGDETPTAEVEPVELPEEIDEEVSGLELNAPAMLIVVMNGNVLSRAITTEEAMVLAGL